MAVADYFDTVQKIYIAFYQRPADPAGLRYWAQRLDGANGDLAAVIDAFANSDEAQALYGEINEETIGDVIDAIYMALFNRAADEAGKQFYVDGFIAGEFTPGTITLNVLNGAQNDDLVAINNKLQVANIFTQKVDGRAFNDPGFGTGTSFAVTYDGNDDAIAARELLAGVTSSPASVLNADQITAALKDKIADENDPIQGETGGKTFALTENVDAGAAFTGGAGDDLFIAADKNLAGIVTATWTAADQIDGGAGVNTFQVTSGAGAIANPAGASVKNIQVMKVVAADVDVDLNTIDFGLETLTVNTSGDGAGTFAVTAAENTDITWAAVEQGGTTVTTQGGNNVTVTATKVDGPAGGVSVTDAAGDVVVSSTGVAYTAGKSATLGNIAVDGGKTISVTQVATSDASKAAKDGAAGTITQGNVTITASDETTEVTVKQDAAVTVKNFVQANPGAVEVVRVDFAAVIAGDTVSVGGLDFTASKDLTANQVAQAFAKLLANAHLPEDVGSGSDADGDTQGSGSFENGVFAGALAEDANTGAWSSSAANGNSVTFTAGKAGVVAVDLTATVSNVGTAVVTTPGAASVSGQAGRMGVAAGTVAIAGDTALETVTVDGYNTGTVTGNNNTALATVNLANGTNMTIDSAAATLELTTSNVNGMVDVQAGTSTLNAAITNNVPWNTVALASASVKALNITGDGNVFGTNAGLTQVESIDASAFEGTATFTIDATRTTYAGGEGSDRLTLAAVADPTKITESIDLGAGDDSLDLTSLDGGAVLQLKDGVVFEGGEGFDTVILSDIAVETVASNTFDANNFLEHISGFEAVKIGTLAADRNIKLGNLGYDSATLVDLASWDLTLADVASGVTVVVEDNTGGGGNVTELKFKGITGTKTAAEANLVIGAEDTTNDIDVGTFKASNLDTLNITANGNDDPLVGGSEDHVVDVEGQYISTINVTGNAESLTMTLDATNMALASIDASTFKGGLVVDLNDIARVSGTDIAITVAGGQGDDVLTASNTIEDELSGGAGNDVLYAGAKNSVLSGGAGNDMFVINTTGNASVADHSIITDFKNGSNLLQLLDKGGNVVTDLIKATGIVQSDTLALNADRAINQAALGEAAWFVWQGSTYVVVDNNADSAAFEGGEDAIIRLTGVDLNDGFSFNSDYGTLALL